MVDVWIVLAGVRMNTSLLNDVKYSAIDIAEAEEPMTIVVRIKSSDGIVLASDSQFTAMYGKIWEEVKSFL
jgi:20S proteasome alpha/beta subunit